MHIGEVERLSLTIIDRVRCTTHNLPFKKYPKLMSNGCGTFNIKLLNQLPADDRVSKTLLPITLVTGLPSMEYEELMKLKFGVYTQVHQENNISNTNEPRSVESTALYPSGNFQGTWYFMSLTTGKKTCRRKWTILPMGQEVIDQVHNLIEAEDKKNIVNNLIFRSKRQ